MAKAFLLVLFALLSSALPAKEAPPAADDPVIEARMLRIASELRCLVCQNQTIADSNAGLAEDLRNELRGLLRQGQSDEQIVKYMTDRYGDFVLYRPPFKASTIALWLGPFAFLFCGFYLLIRMLRRRRVPEPALSEDERARAAKLLE